MQHCTNCGAAAREGAKFCTSCGVRLESGVSVDDAPRDETEQTATVYTVSSESNQEPETQLVEADTETSDSAEPSFQASWPDAEEAPRQVEEEEQAGTSIAPSDGGLAGWPTSTASESAEETPAEPEEETGREDTLSGWGPASVEPSAEPGTDAAASYAPESRTEAAPDEPRRDAGASDWEGWPATPSIGSTVHHHEGADALRDVRELVDALQRRLDRLAAPEPVSARGVDADELAEQLDGWAIGGPDSDDLLWVIRDARDNPRDIDALTRLADRAEELERLVERYGEIRTDAQRWVDRLRRHGGPADA